MYEIFLTALVEDADLSAACAILNGLCGMVPWETVHRVLYFHGPPRPGGIANRNAIEKPMRPDVAQSWKELHQNLSRQSFVLQTRYEVLKDQSFGPGASPMNLDGTQGMLRWTDFPDPPHGRPLLTQRKKVELWDQKRLFSVLRDNNYQFKGEKIEEVYRFFRDDIEFCLSRDYFLNQVEEYSPFERRGAPASPRSSLPTWESLTPIDSQKRWFLVIKAHVLQDNKPDEIRKVQDQVLAIRKELDGVFDFKAIDRKIFDTRVAQQQQGIQKLPQKVMIGRT